ncbi:hypothetical protein MHY85_05075 [Cellulomonas sp. ACRRI]|uniref:hypothetical protein n=1 Tax=Cellulomonas sp. ACRRI TaxID=2918188 RepID=UPI001EF22757|nr:hypothetical protein [Cellulomonas sp. ACRRI]MCG7285347.1 hypothetical protein [Cellulomonas sp. ACRRI]
MIARIRAVPWGAVVAVLAAIALGIGMTYLLHQQRLSGEERARQAAEIDALESAVGEANSRLSAVGETPVDVPAASAPQRGETGATGDRGLQGPQGDMGVPGQQGPPGPPGEDGAPGSVGATGATGARGAAGADGAVGAQGPQGVAGPGPTDEQIAAAVAAYCVANNGCMGPQGVQGIAGPAGEPGAPGPTCAEGQVPQTLTVAAFDDLGLPTQRTTITACVPANQ